MMANKEAIHHRNGDPPKLDKPFPVDGSFVAQTYDLVHATCELETHGLGDPIVWPRKIQRRSENSGRCVVRRGIFGEKSLHRSVDPVQRIAETSLGGKRFVEPGEEFELDCPTELYSETAV